MRSKFSLTVSILLALIMALTPVAAFCDTDISLAENTQADAADNAAEQKEVIGLYEMNVLNSLGIVNFTDGVLNQSVTNEDFAGAAGLIGGIVSDYYQDGALDMLVKSGYLSSACAYPDKSITYAQAVKGMVSVLGYDATAENYGGYPNGYFTQASRLKITKGISNINNDDDLTYGMLCVMMYNALDVKPFYQSEYGDKVSFEKDEKVLTSVFEIYDAYGRVTANSITSLDGRGDYNPGRIEVDGVGFNNSNVSYDDYFGYNVKYYYKLGNADSNKILYMELDENANKIIETDVNDGSYVKDKSIYYYTKNGSVKGASIADGYCLVYNKKVSSKGLEAYQGTINGYVKLVDTNLDGKYDFIEINAYDTIYVSKINTYDKELIDKYDITKKASFDDKTNDTKFIIKDTKGNEITFDAIKKGNVVSVIMSEDGTVGVAVVSADVVTAVVDSVSNPANGSRAHLYCGETEYPVSENLDAQLKNLTPGVEYKLALDFLGFVAGYEKSEDVYEQGLIIDVNTDTKGLKDIAEIKVFSTEGTIKVLPLAEKVKVDGESKENTEACDALYENKAEGKYKSKLIQYSVTNDEVVKIDTAVYDKENESENSLQMVSDDEEKKLVSRDGQCFMANYGKGFVYDSSTTVFMTYMLNDEKNEDEYNILKYTDISSGSYFEHAAGYATSAKTPDVKFVVIGLTDKEATSITSGDFITMMFDHIAKRTDSNGENKYCVVGLDLRKNIKVEQLVDDISLLSGFNIGDIINIRFTYGGAIGQVYKAYDAESNTVLFDDCCATDGTSPVKGPSYGTSQKWLHGKAYASGSSYIYLLTQSKVGTIDTAKFSDCNVVAVKRRTPCYYIYDTKERKESKGKREFLTKVSGDSVNDYLNSGADGADTLLVSTHPTEYTAIVIFR